MKIQLEDHLLINDFYFDTGATISMLFKNKQPNKYIRRIKNPLIDANGVIQDTYSFVIDSIAIGNIFIKRGQFIIWNYSDLPVIAKEKKGIIGMNIIEKANWLFDFKNRQVIVLQKDTVINFPKNHLYLKYDLDELNCPYVSLNINNTPINNILLDTGAESSLDLHKSSYEQITKQSKIISTDTVGSLSIHGILAPSLRSICSDLRINNILTVDTLDINEIKDVEKSKIGFGFIKKFNYFFINTKDRYICLYN